jgi:hypothetical protein
VVKSILAALALSGLAYPTAAVSREYHYSAVYVGQGSKPTGRTHVLLLASDGSAVGIYSLIAKSGAGAGRLNLKQGYWLYCGRWQALPGDKLLVSDRMAESFSYPAPADAAAVRTQTLQAAGEKVGAWHSQLTESGRPYRLTKVPPVDPAALPNLKFTCSQVRHTKSPE